MTKLVNLIFYSIWGLHNRMLQTDASSTTFPGLQTHQVITFVQSVFKPEHICLKLRIQVSRVFIAPAGCPYCTLIKVLVYPSRA